MAIVIFVLGASGWNILSAIREHEALGYQRIPANYVDPEPTEDPSGLVNGTLEDVTAARVYRNNLRLHRIVTTDASKREVVILTLAGIAWVLVSSKVRT